MGNVIVGYIFGVVSMLVLFGLMVVAGDTEKDDKQIEELHDE